LASRSRSAICVSQGGYFNKASNHPLRYAPLLPSLQGSYGNQALILQNWGRLEEAMALL
jgi:hypothetical protein